MLRLLLILSLGVTALFALILLVIRVPYQRPVSGLDSCDGDGLCWDGVQPGVTSEADALARIDTHNSGLRMEAPCYAPHPDTCQNFTWSPPGNPIVYTELQVVSGQISEIVAYNPGLTLGETLLLLEDLHTFPDGADPGFVEDKQFYIQLIFDKSRLIVEALASCQGTYYDLLQTPVRTLELDSANNSTHYVPISTFAAMRRLFYQACGGR